MNPILAVHLAGGVAALFAGTAAAVVHKGGTRHARAGTAFCVSMLVLGLSAAVLLPFKTPPESPIGGLMVCYFVATAWVTARRRDGSAGRFELVAGLAIVLIGALVIYGGVQESLDPSIRPGPPGPVWLFLLGGLCVLAEVGDLRFVQRGTLAPRSRIARHLWRMCFAFFMATGSFFLGQQDMLPAAMRGSAWLLLPAFAPFLLMLYWLVRVPWSRRFARQPA